MNPSLRMVEQDNGMDVELIMKNGALRPVVFKGRLFAQGARPKNGVKLTPRERQIVQLLADGKSNKEVALLLTITVNTAETHRNNIMRKLEFRSMSQLVRYAIRHRLIEA